MLKHIMHNKKKGFTLIELIVVMAILAILVLLAAPKFLGQTKEAQFTKHISNAKVLEDASERYYIDHGKWPRGGDEEVYTPEEVSAYADKVFDITGEEVALTDGKYWDIDYSALETYAKLPNKDERANYVLRNPVGTVYYLEELTEAGEARLPESTLDIPDETVDEPAPWVMPDYYVQATDADFSGTANGAFRYIGTDKHVIMPDTIKGVAVTSYNRMFENSDVQGVVSANPNVTDMSYMFLNSKAAKLDVSGLNTAGATTMSYMFYNAAATEVVGLERFHTANVTSMYAMFYNSSQATTLDLSGFDTANVTNMASMFYGSQATTLDLSSFNTAKVTNMSYMFLNSQATTLDLSSFNTANVTNMSYMFYNAAATEVVGLERFHTANVTNMRYMFASSQATTLDLSSFDLRSIVTGTTSSTSMNGYMFSGAAARTGYARTTADANKLHNTYTYKPTGLTFVVK